MHLLQAQEQRRDKFLLKKIKQAGPLYLGIGLIHLIGIGLLFLAAQHHSSFWGLGVLAYFLGLRHAFDADHITAIDNTVRKLIHQQKASTGTGFFFSLGHSTVVFLMVVGISFSVEWIKVRLPLFEHVGGLLGAVVSGIFLISMALINLVVLINLWRLSRLTNRPGHPQPNPDHLLASRGFLTRFIGPMFNLVNHEWQMYLVGFLFGLGFDTASEIGLIAMSAIAAQTNTLSIGVIALPILFAAGMVLMDTTDSVMMASAYHWAFETPERKMGYNLIVTSISTTAAFLVGSLELIQVTTATTAAKSQLAQLMSHLNFNWLGYGLFGTFIVIWGGAYLLWHFLRKPNLGLKS